MGFILDRLDSLFASPSEASEAMLTALHSHWWRWLTYPLLANQSLSRAGSFLGACARSLGTQVNIELLESEIDSFLNFKHMRCAIDRFAGAGDEHSTAKAKAVAIYECIERICWHRFQSVDESPVLRFEKDFYFCGVEKRSEGIWGSAIHTSVQQAVLSALLETIERDAFLCHWITKIGPPVLDSTLVLSESLSLFLKRRDLKFRSFLLKSAWNVPVVLSVVFDEVLQNGHTYYCQGLGAGESIDVAARRSMKELSRFIRLTHALDGKYESHIGRPLDLNHPINRFFYYQDPSRFKCMRWLIDSDENAKLKIGGADLRKRVVSLETLSANAQSSILLRPHPVPRTLLNRFFSCSVEVSSLQALSYDPSFPVNVRRISEFLGEEADLVEDVIGIHPLP